MGKIPKHYTAGLSKKGKKKQISEIRKSQRLRKKGIYYTRKKIKGFKSKKSGHVLAFERKYGIKITNSAAVARKTGVSVEKQKAVLAKGRGAYYSSGSRPGQTPSSWAYARLASTLLKRKAYKYDKGIIKGTKKK